MSENRVILYTSEPCAQCDKVRDLLNSWGVVYEERLITGHPEYRKMMQDEGVYGTPVTFVNKEEVLGVQENRLKKKLSA
ncbi:glutaredoxin family protein [Salimicrobium flavidum]|uniref:Glutaredoxin-like protein NrdH n=1 Tax=Salimicrobium flavidum TaxID=570947 RepID=A0A1N7K5K1_9BACI|nr:glutaredoxin family protein [Salimicrobium flavidum]SIS56882.1 glutaredoxin-like protein NrdH [Salimicrobium flavidum]